MHAVTQQEHQWLQQMVGEWTYEHECIMAPGQPPMKFQGAETVRTLGGLWVLCEGRGEMPEGGTATTVLTLGFDPARKRFVGTFVASMMTHMWVYDGGLDSSARVLTLDTEGPSFTDQTKMARYQDIIEIISPDHRTLSSQALGDDGQWHRFLTAHYRRTK